MELNINKNLINKIDLKNDETKTQVQRTDCEQIDSIIEQQIIEVQASALDIVATQNKAGININNVGSQSPKNVNITQTDNSNILNIEPFEELEYKKVTPVVLTRVHLDPDAIISQLFKNHF